MAETPPDKTQAAFAALVSVLPTERVALEVNLTKLCHPHCPVPFDYLKNLVVYGYLVLCFVVAVAVLALGFEKAALWWSLGILTAVYWIGARPLIEMRIRKRIARTIMEEPERLEKIWRYGGVALVDTDGTRANAPQDDWRAFALRPRN